MRNPGIVREKSGLFQILSAFWKAEESFENTDLIDIEENEANKNNITEETLKMLKNSLRGLKTLEKEYEGIPKAKKKASNKIQKAKSNRINNQVVEVEKIKGDDKMQEM